MKKILALLIAVTVLAACGVKRPLITPAAIPAYEKARKEKREKLELDVPAPAAPSPQNE